MENISAVEWFAGEILKSRQLFGASEEFDKLYARAKAIEESNKEAAFLAGFKVSGEGRNGEYPHAGETDERLKEVLKDELAEYFKKKESTPTPEETSMVDEIQQIIKNSKLDCKKIDAITDEWGDRLYFYLSYKCTSNTNTDEHTRNKEVLDVFSELAAFSNFLISKSQPLTAYDQVTKEGIGLVCLKRFTGQDEQVIKAVSLWREVWKLIRTADITDLNDPLTQQIVL